MGAEVGYAAAHKPCQATFLAPALGPDTDRVLAWSLLLKCILFLLSE